MAQSERLSALEALYLIHDDPLRQCGWFGAPELWRAQREISLEAVHRDGAILDVGCANGYLMECIAAWGLERGFSLDPFGVDIGPRLIDLARQRLPHWSDRLFIGDSGHWRPSRRFDFVHAGSNRDPHHVERLLREFVEPGGRLILRSYFIPKGTDPWNSYFDNAALIESMGLVAAGTLASDPPGAEFVWVDG